MLGVSRAFQKERRFLKKKRLHPLPKENNIILGKNALCFCSNNFVSNIQIFQSCLSVLPYYRFHKALFLVSPLYSYLFDQVLDDLPHMSESSHILSYEKYKFCRTFIMHFGEGGELSEHRFTSVVFRSKSICYLGRSKKNPLRKIKGHDLQSPLCKSHHKYKVLKTLVTAAANDIFWSCWGTLSFFIAKERSSDNGSCCLLVCLTSAVFLTGQHIKQKWNSCFISLLLFLTHCFRKMPLNAPVRCVCDKIDHPDITEISSSGILLIWLYPLFLLPLVFLTIQYLICHEHKQFQKSAMYLGNILILPQNWTFVNFYLKKKSPERSWIHSLYIVKWENGEPYIHYKIHRLNKNVMILYF